jgi:hypothetical protein
MRYVADTIPVFSGPTLADWQAQPPFARFPPAAAGDLLRLADGPACTVLLIDGLFDQRRSVWHKEILLLLARGFRVIGAASMGALRAAELAPFGMIGYGSIFKAFASGRIAADDEVAVIHAPAEFSSMAFSVAQVDVRAVLVRAVRLGVIHVDSARALREISGAIHYRDRTWPDVVSAGEQAELRVAPLASWLQTHGFSQKADDARGALALALKLSLSQPPVYPEPPVTDFLREAARSIGLELDRGPKGGQLGSAE